MMRTRTKRSNQVCIAAVGLALFGIMMILGAQQAWAVDPVPDYKTLVMPTLVPKAGHGATPPADAQPGVIRNTYDKWFEDYWKETSYFRYDAATGQKIRGYYNDSKTYGYVQIQWPVKSRTDCVNATGNGDGFDYVVHEGLDKDGKLVRMYSANIDSSAMDGATFDYVWTPGESFNDVNGNGQWDPEQPGTPAVPGHAAESYWNANNAQIDGVLFGLFSTTGNAWDPDRGEYFADYNYTADAGNNMIGFDTNVVIWLADLSNRLNVAVSVSEFDMVRDRDSGEILRGKGDMQHTYNDMNGLGAPPVGAFIASNGVLDYTEGPDGANVHVATNRTGQPVTIEYYSFRYLNTPGNPPYKGNEPADPGNTNGVGLMLIQVPVYQAGELFVNRVSTNGPLSQYGDDGSQWTIVNDGTCTPAVPDIPEGDPIPAEPFEDFISWNNQWVLGIPDPYSGEENPRGRPETNAITYAAYTNYVRWNYPGDKDALAERAGNGIYDGPELWAEEVNTKIRITGYLPDLYTLEPTSDYGHWDGRFFADWTDWWASAFGERTLTLNGHYYMVVSGPATWEAAKLDAEARGGYLVKIDSAEENTFVQEFLNALDVGDYSYDETAEGYRWDRFAWIGASDAAEEGQWLWGDGSAVSNGFSSWNEDAGEPSDSSGGENYAAMALFLKPGQWHDLWDFDMLPYVIEFDEPPTGSRAAFAPSWDGRIPIYGEYTPSNGGPGGWIPATTWEYDGPREFCDLPSALYHIGGFPAGSMRATYHVRRYPDTGTMVENLVGFYGADGLPGEPTSPWVDSIYGQDLWPESATGAKPSGPDGTLPSCGPFAYNIHGLHGFDAGNALNLELLTWTRFGNSGTDLHGEQFRDTNLDGIMDTGRGREGDPHYSAGEDGETCGGNGAGPYPFNRQRFMEELVEQWDHSEDFSSFVSHITGARIPLYGFPIYPTSEGNAGWAALGGPAGAKVSVLTRDDVDPYLITFQVRPMDATGEVGGQVFDAGPGAFVMGLLCHEQGHDIQGWPDLYDYDVWSIGNDILNGPISGYDLMAGGFVHGVANLKETAGWLRDIPDLKVVVPEGERVTVEMYPVEDFPDQYYRLVNTNQPGEFFDFWYTYNDTSFGVPGGAGVYVAHMDLYGDPNALPRQQRVNNHYVWEIVQADGRSDLEDRVNGGDSGDPFPGDSGKTTFSGDTDPATRWWDQTDCGLRIVDIRLPEAAGAPALVTFERMDTSAEWLWPAIGADTDADGMVDTWEYHYFGDLTTSDGTTDSDFDGLSDRGEYLAKCDPTNDDISTDADDDADGDDINNVDEVDVYGSDPSLPDTDDDGVPDGLEFVQHTSPTNSLDPLFGRVLDVSGTDGTYVEMPGEPDDFRFAMPGWTIEAWVKPRTLGGGEATIVSRQDRTSGRFNYFLGIGPDRRVVARFSPTDRTPDVEAKTVLTVASNTWTHLMARFEPSNGVLRIYINGLVKASRVTAKRPLQSGDYSMKMRVGRSFNGWIDEVRVWSAYPGDRLIEDLRKVLTGAEAGLVSYLRFDDTTSEGGTSGLPALTLGQVEDYTQPHNWSLRWMNAGTLVGEAGMVPTDELLAPGTPRIPDDDGDGLPDWWELLYFGDLISDGAGDIDDDGLANSSEFVYFTDPTNPDTDGDGLSDWEEVFDYGTGGAESDSDHDGLHDGDEVQIYHTNPSVADTDDDRMDDGDEVIAGTSPTDPADVLIVSGVTDHTGTLLQWPSAPARRYSIATKDSLAQPDWTWVATNIPATPPMNVHTVDVSAPHPSFYRINVEQP